jgi:DNA-binding NtrC family response regulator
MSAASNPLPLDDTSELEIKNILLLDDDQELADTLKQLLELHNFVVTTVSNGAEGLREVMELDFDVIICDMLMPHMPGDMFYLAVQKVKPHLARRFIFITGHSEMPKINEFLEKVNGLVIYKPAHIEDIVRMISLVLKRAREEPV